MKYSPDKQFKNLCHQLSQCFISQYDIPLKCLNFFSYSASHKIGTYLSNQIKQTPRKSRIYFLLDKQEKRLTYPLHIANRFAEYYNERYNLNSTQDLPTPSATPIQTFLCSLHLPKISKEHFTDVSAQFSSDLQINHA